MLFKGLIDISKAVILILDHRYSRDIVQKCPVAFFGLAPLLVGELQGFQHVIDCNPQMRNFVVSGAIHVRGCVPGVRDRGHTCA